MGLRAGHRVGARADRARPGALGRPAVPVLRRRCSRIGFSPASDRRAAGLGALPFPRRGGSLRGPDLARRAVDFLQPTTWGEALQARAERPDALPIAGGTDVMVELNFDRRRPGALLDLGRVPELREWTTDDGLVRLGAGGTHARVVPGLGPPPARLAMAARTVGSPQIRNRGTAGGNLGAASPAGDSHPPLLAAFAEGEAESVRGVRRIPAAEFYTGVKRHALAPDELIKAVLIAPASGPQQFCKIGTR